MTYWEPEGYHQLGEREYAGITTTDVLQRMQEATGVKCLRELADWLGARRSWLSDAQRRNIMPARWLQALVLKLSEYSPVWVLTGQGEKLWSEGHFAEADLEALQLGDALSPDVGEE